MTFLVLELAFSFFALGFVFFSDLVLGLWWFLSDLVLLDFFLDLRALELDSFETIVFNKTLLVLFIVLSLSLIDILVFDFGLSSFLVLDFDEFLDLFFTFKFLIDLRLSFLSMDSSLISSFLKVLDRSNSIKVTKL